MMPIMLKTLLAKKIPSQPGVYLMKDTLGRVIYVGKAKDLRKRVQSYFKKEERERYQVKFLMAKVHDIETIVTANEREAFILENTLIKKHAPRYNLQLKDDKSYASIKLSIKDKFPRIYVTRTITQDGSCYFGPYSSAFACRQTVDFIEQHFRLRTCSDHEFANRVRPCLQHQIGRCDAPCVGKISEADYGEQVRQVRLFLQGKNQELVKLAETQMKTEAETEQFEKATKSRDLLFALRETLAQQSVAKHNWLDQDMVALYREGERVTVCVLLIRQGKVWDSLLYHLKSREEPEIILESFLGQFYGEDRIIPDEIVLGHAPSTAGLIADVLTEKKGENVRLLFPKGGDRRDLLRIAYKNAETGFRSRAHPQEESTEVLDKLRALLHLQNYPRRMECFDISNTQGAQSVGSLVSFLEGEPDKSHYKRFKIKTVVGPDDFASMREVLRRRLTHLKDSQESAKWERPDLIVIDGGKGQLSAVETILAELNITGIDLISLAKPHGTETQDKVFLPGRKNPVKFGKNSNQLHLLMKIRDEAHRFAITYHKKLRAQEFLPLSKS